MNNYMTEVNQLIQMIQKHYAWWDIIGKEAEKTLIGCPPNTFLLRKGENDLHYFLSYVTHHSVIFHQSIRINKDPVGYYENGGARKPTKLFTTIDPLISEILVCPKEDLLPISYKLLNAHGF